MNMIRYAALAVITSLFAAASASGQSVKMPIRTADLAPVVHAEKPVLPMKGGVSGRAGSGRPGIAAAGQQPSFGGQHAVGDPRATLMPIKSGAGGAAGVSGTGRAVTGSAAGHPATGQPTPSSLAPIKTSGAGQQPKQP